PADATRPAILLVEPHAEHLESGREFLRADCAQTFDVVTASSVDEARRTLEEAHDERQPVILMLVRHLENEDEMRELLVHAKKLFSGIKVILYADELDPQFAVRGKRGGLVDYSITEPWESPEVALQPILNDVLRTWETHPATNDVVQVYGDPWSPRCHSVKDLLARHRVPYRWNEVEEKETPRVVFPDGTELRSPTDEDIAQKLGFGTTPEEDFYDLIIVGGGPAGLAAAVYASSEGLRTVVIEADVPGGQAGTSALIENYLGFPDGLSGAELASRAVTQAQKFGAEILLTKGAKGLRDERGYRAVILDDDTAVVGHAVLLATGVEYRRLDAEGAERLTGAGLYYGAAAAEAARFRGEEICLLGSGNSAAQAALLLARYVNKLTIITVDEQLHTMSQYLLERIEELPNVELLTKTGIVEVKGEDRVQSVVVENVDTHEKREIATAALFVWIGARPHTDWLVDVVERDEQGYVLTGRDLKPERRPLESSMEGIFVAGDVRHGSVKRVGSAVGEGAMAVQFIHDYLRDR
ncbi:MAG TPA: FAD-dependent oxidoreductase, partial [Thermoanaerobaculia bacterium]|nr:FAD-dependent oxidoreductase [Thermoanaerobaculia bacterium]